jgi:5-methylcytosine-specific restriction endonuclease McrA
VEPLAPTRCKVQFTASAQLREKLERLQALCPGDDIAEVIEQAVTERLERLEARRFARVAKPRRSLADAAPLPSSRYIPAPVRRAVYERDGGCCTYTDSHGRRCSSRRDLEFHHHEQPYGRGGEHSVRNLRLMCPTHNALLAERDYGTAAMARHRRSEGRVSEGGAPYRPSVVAMPLTRHPAAG